MRYLFPQADIPLIQLSIDYFSPPEMHYNLGRELNALREQGILIIGSGNIVHNLPGIKFDMEGGYDWAYEFDDYIKDKIMQGNHQSIVKYTSAGKSAGLAVPTPDHFYPLLYVLGATD